MIIQKISLKRLLHLDLLECLNDIADAYIVVIGDVKSALISGINLFNIILHTFKRCEFAGVNHYAITDEAYLSIPSIADFNSSIASYIIE